MNRFIVMPGGRPVRVFCLVWLILIITRGQAAADASIVYDPNPHHLWNRLNETLFDRTAQDGKKYGLDELDILYWRTTQHLPGFASQNPPPAQLQLNPDLPQFPPQTEWALVRRLCVIDTAGHIQPTPITESIQMRRYLAIESVNQGRQQVFEFKMEPQSNAALRAIAPGERGFSSVHFMGLGIDPFESAFASRDQEPAKDSSKLQNVELDTCLSCHMAPGIFSVNSYTHFLVLPTSVADLTAVEDAKEATPGIFWKQSQSSWGLLQGLWPPE